MMFFLHFFICLKHDNYKSKILLLIKIYTARHDFTRVSTLEVYIDAFSNKSSDLHRYLKVSLVRDSYTYIQEEKWRSILFYHEASSKCCQLEFLLVIYQFLFCNEIRLVLSFNSQETGIFTAHYQFNF